MLIFVTTQKTRRVALVKSLNEHGVFAFVTSPEQARETVLKKDTGGVLLDTVGCLGICQQLCADLHRDFPQMPIGAIVTSGAVPNMDVDCILREQNEELLKQDVFNFCVQICGCRSEILSTYCLSVTSAPEQTLYMGYRMPLSPMEHAILRLLFYRFPSFTSSEDLLELCDPEKKSSRQTLAVLIGRINNRAKQINQQNLIIHQRGKGYRLRDGIVNDIPHKKTTRGS